MATITDLERLALEANNLTMRGNEPASSAGVVERARGLVRQAKEAGLSCERVTQPDRTGYDCTDAVTKALLQVRVAKKGDLATLTAAVFGLDRARRPSATKETPLARATRDRDRLSEELDRCRRECSTRSLF